MDPGEVLWGLKQDLLPEFIIDALAFIQHISYFYILQAKSLKELHLFTAPTSLHIWSNTSSVVVT